MIEKNSSTPMYKQIYSKIKNEILENKYEINGNIGTHNLLAKKYNVSLITIRKAVQLLYDENLVTIQQGKGTFVNDAVIKDDLQHLTGITNISLKYNINPEVNVITFDVISIPEEFSNDLKKSLGKKCIYIKRIHRVKNKTIAFAEIYLPEKYIGIINKKDIEQQTVYDIYQNKLGINLGYGIQKIKAGSATDYIANYLNVEVNSPIAIITRRAYCKEKKLIEYMKLYYEHNSYYIEVKLDLTTENKK